MIMIKVASYNICGNVCGNWGRRETGMLVSLDRQAPDIIALQDRILAAPGSAVSESDIWAEIGANHWHNSRIWDEEDLARRRNVPNSEIAANKRAIDAHNQKRNNAIKFIDWTNMN